MNAKQLQKLVKTAPCPEFNQVEKAVEYRLNKKFRPILRSFINRINHLKQTQNGR